MDVVKTTSESEGFCFHLEAVDFLIQSGVTREERNCDGEMVEDVLSFESTPVAP